MKFHMIAIGSEFAIEKRIFRKITEMAATNQEGEICHFDSEEAIQMTRGTILATVTV